MHGRWFNTGVVLLWLTTMSWLVKEKVLPPLLTGQPPRYSEIIKAQKYAPPVGWQILCNEEPIGWALSDAKPQQSGLTEIRGRVHVRTFPLRGTTSSGLRTLLKWAGQHIDDLQLDAWNVLKVDSLGRLAEFDSTVRVDPFQETISVSGVVENGNQLHLQFRAGGASFRSEAYLPSQGLLSDALSPQMELPGLRAGQSWTVPVYSPFLPAQRPLEIIYATVEGREPDVLGWRRAGHVAGSLPYRAEKRHREQSGSAGQALGPSRRQGVETTSTAFRRGHRLHSSDRGRSRGRGAVGRHAVVDSGRRPRELGKMIEFVNTTRTFARTVAVDRLTLTVPQGELFALLGPNGAGKTTAIKMLTGLLRPTAGKVRVCGHDLVSDVRQATRSIGYVPEEPFLYDKLTGREFLRFMAEMRGLDRPTVDARLERECKVFDLDDFIDDLAETYSHGMKQRLIFASALLHDPPVLVIDEPMVGLDPRSVRVTKDLLRARAAAGTTVFMSTHTLAIAEEIADRIGIMDHGRLHFLGTVAELQRELASHHASLEALFLELTDNRNGHGEARSARAAKAAAGAEPLSEPLP